MDSKIGTGRSLIISVLMLSFLSSPILSPETTSNPTGSEFLPIEKKLLHYINKERQKKGLATVHLFKPLNQIAWGQSKKMALSGQLNHFFPGSGSLGQRLREARLFFSGCAENLILSDIPVASVIHNELMHSGPHRANIMNPDFSHCGIRICSRGDKYYITQVFARLFDPSTDREAEFHLQEDLELWFVEAFNSRFVFHHQSQRRARQLSQQSLKGEKPSKPPERWGNLSTFQMVYPDLKYIREKLQEEISGVKLDAISIGVASGRTRDFPSGTYAVSALLFGNHYHRLAPAQLTRILLNRLNQLRAEYHLPVLKINHDLSQQAFRIVKTRPQKESAARSLKNHIILTFSLKNPHLIPSVIRDHLLVATPHHKEIGMAIHIPGQKKISPQRFEVCLIMEK